jgi:hypothetical protein
MGLLAEIENLRFPVYGVPIFWVGPRLPGFPSGTWTGYLEKIGKYG